VTSDATNSRRLQSLFTFFDIFVPPPPSPPFFFFLFFLVWERRRPRHGFVHQACQRRVKRWTQGHRAGARFFLRPPFPLFFLLAPLFLSFFFSPPCTANTTAMSPQARYGEEAAIHRWVRELRAAHSFTLPGSFLPPFPLLFFFPLKACNAAPRFDAVEFNLLDNTFPCRPSSTVSLFFSSHFIPFPPPPFLENYGTLTVWNFEHTVQPRKPFPCGRLAPPSPLPLFFPSLMSKQRMAGTRWPRTLSPHDNFRCLKSLFFLLPSFFPFLPFFSLSHTMKTVR